MAPIVTSTDLASRLETVCRAWLRGDHAEELSCLNVFPELHRSNAVTAAAALLDDLCETRPTSRGCVGEALNPDRRWFELERAKRVADALADATEEATMNTKVLLLRSDMPYYDAARARRVASSVDRLCDDKERAADCATFAPLVLEQKLPHYDAANAERVLAKLMRRCIEGSAWGTCTEAFAHTITRHPQRALIAAKRLCEGAAMCGSLAHCYRFGGCGVAKDLAKAKELESRTPKRKPPEEVHCCWCAINGD